MGGGCAWKGKSQPPRLVDQPSDYLSPVHVHSRNPRLARVRRGLLIYTERFPQEWKAQPLICDSLLYPNPDPDTTTPLAHHEFRINTPRFVRYSFGGSRHIVHEQTYPLFYCLRVSLLQQSGHLLLLAVTAPLLWPAAGFGVPLMPRQQEWNDYTASHAGKWRGVWTTYDPSGIQQGEADRVDTTLDLSGDGTHLRHINTLYVGSVGSECTTCFDSVETKEVLVEECTRDKFRQRASGAAYLSGPGVARRGDMITEVGFRDEDRRVRCIISHRPQFNGLEPPSQLALERIVIVRETQALGEDVSPSVEPLWSEVGQSDWPGLWRGRSMILENDVGVGVVGDALAWTEEKLTPSHLDECRCRGAAESSHMSLKLDGGIFIDAPAIVSAGEPAELGVRWAIGPRNAVGATRKRIVQTKVRLEALTRIIDTTRGAEGVEECRISPPKLLRFAVENLEPVELA